MSTTAGATWQQITSGTLVPGEVYRVRFDVRCPYTAANVAKVKSAIDAKLARHAVKVLAHDHAPGTFSAHGTGEMWPMIVRFQATEPTSALQQLEAAVLLALMSVFSLAGVAIYTAARVVEKLEHAVADEAKRKLQSVFDPTLLIVAAVAAFLILRRK